MFLKIIIFTTLYISVLFSAQLSVSSNEVKNANTVLVTLKEKDINNPKLTFDKQNIKFFKYPNKIDTYYALVPISYYKKFGNYKIITSYMKNGKKIFQGISIKVIDAKYKSETINVPKGKVSLSKENKKRTKKEYASAMKIYNTTTDTYYIKDKSINPINSDITSSFGKKRVYNGTLKSYHSGTDFKAPIGTPIKAINDGVIAISEDRFYAGNSIVINHGQGIYSCYFHLTKMNYNSGDYVKKGDIVGLSGSTGRVTGPHLHFSFRVHGIQVDPLQLVKLLNNF